MYSYDEEEKEVIPANDRPRPGHPLEDIQNDRGKKPVNIPSGSGHHGQKPWTDRDPKKPVK